MKVLSYLKDKDFLRALDNDNNKNYWIKIDVINANEYPIQSILKVEYSQDLFLI